MRTKIKTLVVVSQPGVRIYEVGCKINDLKIDRIIPNNENPFSGENQSVFVGYDKDDKIIFQTVNAPVDVQYEKIIY